MVAAARERPRWPAWAPRVAREHGVRSILCLRLFTKADTLGVLDLDSRTDGAFGGQDRDDGEAIAAHVAIALLARISSDTNTKLLVIARELVRTREIPDSR